MRGVRRHDILNCWRVLGRGSIAQTALATVISFGFFALHLDLMPYKSFTLNVAKAVSEVQIFVVLLVCVILQTNRIGLDSELVSIDAYGVIQTLATILIVPVAFLEIMYNLKDVSRIDDTTENRMQMEFANPLDADECAHKAQME